MDRGLVTFFDVTKCGFYRIRRKENQESAESGSLEDTVAKIYDWVNGRDFNQSIPWDTASSPARAKFYCKSFYKDETTGDLLLVFWKQHSDDDGSLNGIIADSKCGDSVDDSVKVGNKVQGKTVVYGQPSYYWFIPEHNLLASIKFSHSIADTGAICHWIKSCFDYRINTPGKKVSERDFFNPATQEYLTVKSMNYLSEDGKYHLTYKLEAEVQKACSNNIDVNKLSKEITHIVVRDTISAQLPDDRNGWMKIWDKVSHNKPEVFRQKHVEIVSEVILSEDELRDIITTHDESFSSNNGWNNIGFKTLGNDSTKWFNQYVDRKYIHMNGDDFLNTYFPAEKVYKEILAKREGLLELAVAVKLENSEVEAETEIQENVLPLASGE